MLKKVILHNKQFKTGSKGDEKGGNNNNTKEEEVIGAKTKKKGP
jgi:hypothetical protein